MPDEMHGRSNATGLPPRAAWLLLALAVLGGVWWAFCFDERPGLLAPIAAAVPLLLISSAPLGPWQRLGFGWLHGAVAWLVATPWIASTLTLYGGLPRAASFALLTLLAVYLGLYHGLFCLFAGFASVRRRRFAVAFVPAIWVGLEWCRGLGAPGFPWNLLGHAWVDVPGALDATRWIGSHGLSALVIAVAWALVRLGHADTRRLAALTLAAAAGLLALARWTNLDAPQPAGPAIDVAVVQPNIHMATAETNDANDGARAVEIRDNYRRLFALSREACEPGRLVVWPESASWPYQLDRDPVFTRHVEELVAGGCSLLLNGARWDRSRDRSDESGGRAFNAAYLLTPAPERARRQHYDKMHLVPFGEYVPLARFLPRIRQIARHAGGFSPGSEARPLDAEGARLGVSICFEIVFPGQVAARVRHGATVLVTLTNDSWYGRTWAPHQHLRPARFRAAENGRPLIRAAITGISAFIDHRGQVTQRAEIDSSEVLEASVVPLDDRTPFSRAPLLVPLLCVALAAFAILRP